jgi:carboxymethylenebutenolidase
MTDITLPGARGTMGVYVAEPEGDGPWPGVVVISDALGMTTDLRNQADWLASEGYLAAAPDLYYWGGRIGCMFTTIRQALRREGSMFDDLETLRRWLADHEHASGKVGVIGFCLGGGFALLLAGLADYDAASVNYGGVPKDAVTLLADACPIVGSYGAKDRGLTKDRERLEGAMTHNAIPHDVVVYPEAGHSFMNDHLVEETPRWAMVMGRFANSDYHEPSALDARRRINSFFRTHLRE